MTQVTEAIFENGVLRPLNSIHLTEHDRVRITIDSIEANGADTSAQELLDDPLSGVGMSTGISDLAEHFDDYRFGRRLP